MSILRSLRLLPAIAAILAGPSAAQTQYSPPEHTEQAPLYTRLSPQEAAYEANRATQVERDRSAKWTLAEHRRLDRALAALQPQRKGFVDAYVVAVGTDSDPVFGREAREAAKVLSRRWGAAGHTITLAMSDGKAESDLPRGSPDALAMTLARVAELMDRDEDVLILYTTGHGAPIGLAYNDGNAGFGVVGPEWLKRTLAELGIRNRMLLLSACYAGVFIAPLASPGTAIVTAASTDRTSFGCAADNDWTFFGDALVNHALRGNTGFAAAVEAARAQIGKWEAADKLTPSQPSVMIGGETARWLAAIEARVPAAATQPVGRPATDALKELRK